MTWEEFKEKAKDLQGVYISEDFIFTDNFIFHRNGDIEYHNAFSNIDREFLCHNRTVEQLDLFLKAIQ